MVLENIKENREYLLPMLGEYRVQTYLVFLQTLVVLCGGAWLWLCARFNDLNLNPKAENYLVVALKEWGFLAILVPLAWAGLTIYFERNGPSWFTARWTLVTGLLLALGLTVVFFSAGRLLHPPRGPIQVF